MLIICAKGRAGLINAAMRLLILEMKNMQVAMERFKNNASAMFLFMLSEKPSKHSTQLVKKCSVFLKRFVFEGDGAVFLKFDI